MTVLLQTREHRVHERIDADYDIVCSKVSFDENVSFDRFKVFDISASGLAFISKKDFVIGDLLKIEISIKGWEKFNPEFFKYYLESEKRPIVVLGSIKRIHLLSDGSYKIAVNFAGIDPGHKLALKRIFDKKLKKEQSE